MDDGVAGELAHEEHDVVDERFVPAVAQVLGDVAAGGAHTAELAGEVLVRGGGGGGGGRGV